MQAVVAVVKAPPVVRVGSTAPTQLVAQASLARRGARRLLDQGAMTPLVVPLVRAVLVER